MEDLGIDGHKLHYHPKRVDQWLQHKDDWDAAKFINPIYVEIAPTGACNHRCSFCSVDYLGYKPVNIDRSALSNALIEMKSLNVRSIMYAGEGEPLVNHEINSIVQETRRYGIDVAFTTNGVLLDRHDTISDCSWVKVSINAGREESYRRVHKARDKDWSKVWANIRAAAKVKGKCKLGVQAVILPETINEMWDLMVLAQESGADYLVLKPYTQAKYSINRMNIDMRDQLPILKAEADAVSKAGFKVIVREEAIKTRAPTYTKCQATPYFWAYIMANGDVYTCSAYLNDDRFRIGNINEQSFTAIWRGEKRRENWEYVRNKLDITECRVNCRMDKVNRYLTGFEEAEHVNFI